MIRKVIVLGGGSAGFLAALALKVKMPDLRVLVIRSKEIGIIGVGEGSTPPLTNFLHDFLRLPARGFVEGANPTFKLGLRFVWGPRDHFDYPFGPQIDSRVPGLPKCNAFYCQQDMENSSLYAAMMAQEKVFQRNKDGSPILQWDVAYHFENEKFVTFLERYASSVGIEILDDTVGQVMQDEAGVSGLALKSGRTESADLYVDCSGFLSLLLGKTLGEPFVGYQSTLFCDRAVVGGWDRTDEPIHPYTTCSTMNSGWLWQIEHENRINRGYVYSSAFISDEEAEREFRSISPKVQGTRMVKFVSGRYERAWVKNVVAIGNASAFVEPLEATSLGMIGMRSRLLSEILMECDRQVPRVHVDLYNRHHVTLWDSIRKFLAIHYRFNTRLDTPFWRECREKTDLAGAEPVVDYYKQTGPTGLWGPAVVDGIEPFPLGSYFTLMVGQKVPHAISYTPSGQEWALWNAQRQKYRSAASAAMTVKEALVAARGAAPHAMAS